MYTYLYEWYVDLHVCMPLLFIKYKTWRTVEKDTPKFVDLSTGWFQEEIRVLITKGKMITKHVIATVSEKQISCFLSYLPNYFSGIPNIFV